MRPVFHTLSILVVLLSLNACRTTTSKQEPNVGPFDSHGRYVEAWADDPSKWRPYTPKDVEGDPPKIAKNEQPLDNSVPLATGDSPTSRAKSLRNGSDSSRQLSRNSTSKAKADTGQTAKKSSKSKADTEHTAKKSTKAKTDTESTAKKSTKAKTDTGSMAKKSTKAKTDTEPTAKKSTKAKTDAEPTAKKSTKAKTDAEPTAKKSTKAKSSASTSTRTKSSSTHHTVKHGESLYTIAEKYDTSVSALKAANGLSSTAVREGKPLVIPARK